ncbi:hypothetical protein V7052_25860, partial [Bacillus wiedmannii]|uniref:hypothetical protein n=1 Tax=Bacillus wiedmannii TaxID=1890302 RepID=UPI002FFDFBC5
YSTNLNIASIYINLEKSLIKKVPLTLILLQKNLILNKVELNPEIVNSLSSNRGPIYTHQLKKKKCPQNEKMSGFSK